MLFKMQNWLSLRKEQNSGDSCFSKAAFRLGDSTSTCKSLIKIKANFKILPH